MDVYFDDFKVSHTFSDVVFASDYYPFGLAMEDRKIEREQYRFGYQGQFAEKDEETGWNAFELRMYNSRIGRWMAVDPYRQFASPYVGMGNNPVNGVDPDGGYSKFGATWRSVLYGGGPIYESGGEWGFNVGTGDNMVSMFGKYSEGNRVSSSNLGFVGMGLAVIEDNALKGIPFYQKNFPIRNDDGKVIANMGKYTPKLASDAFNYLKLGATAGGVIVSSTTFLMDYGSYSRGSLSGAEFTYNSTLAAAGIGVGFAFSATYGTLFTLNISNLFNFYKSLLHNNPAPVVRDVHGVPVSNPNVDIGMPGLF